MKAPGFKALWLALSAIVLVVGLMSWVVAPIAQSAPDGFQQQQNDSAQIEQAATPSRLPSTKVGNAATLPDAVLMTEMSIPDMAAGLDKTAILSMSEARLKGDARRPPMASRQPVRELPTDDELNDPVAYARYETRQEQQLYQAFVDAVPAKVAAMENVLEQARQPGSGVSDDELAMAEDKIARLNAMKAQLLQEQEGLVDRETVPVN